jgi:CshA-type fibril repeat protein
VTAVAGTTTSAGNDGYYQSGTVSGHLYIDTNGDGNQDAGEPNLANVDVEITDANGNTQTVTTDANGNWSATVPPGSTTADVDETDPQYPTGYTQTEGTDPTTVTAVAGTTTSAGNDGYYQSGTVSGHLYIDTNGDGNQDAGEPDLANVDVEITDANGNTQTVTTDASGNWSATVPPGSTTADVDETDPQYPTGYAQTEGTDPTTVTAVAGTNVSAGNDGYTPGIPPVAVNDSRSNLRPGPALTRVAANDSDPDTNTTLDLSCIDLDPATSGQQTTYTVSGQGTWRLGTGGQVTFFPQAGFTQDPTPIGYTICNTGGLTSNIATITLDYAPVASNDSSFNNPVGTPVTLNVVLNDVKGDVVDPTTVKILGTANPGDPLVVPGQGTWSVNPTTGAITFTPQSGFTGDPSPIRYTVRDYDGNLSNVATVTVTYVKPCTGFPLTLVIDDLSTPGIDHIIVDGSPVGTSTALGTSTQLDAAPETQGQVSFSGSTARFSFVKVQALSKPFLTSTSPDIQITASFKSSAAGQIVVRATDGCYGVTSGSPQQLVSPIGGTTAGKVVFKETVDWQNRQFGQSGSTTKTNNYTSPAPGAFSGQPSSSFTPAQPWVSLTKQVNVSHSRANQLTTLNAGGKILPLVAAAVSQSFVGLHASPWTTQELVGLPSWAQPSVARQPVSTAQVAQQTLFADSGLAASGTSVVSGSAAIDEVMQGWSGRFGEDLDSGL